MSSVICKTAVVGASAVIAAGVSIGSRTVVAELAFVGPAVRIGADCSIGPGVRLQNCTIGDHVILHAGCCIGQDGFGFEPAVSGPHRKKPQTLAVTVGDKVEIGANSTVDRGSWRDTVIGSGTKVDNHVQIGHNVQTGAHCLIAAQTGIGGSVTMGDRVFIGAQSGVLQHLRIGHGAKIAARSGVMRHVADRQTVAIRPSRLGIFTGSLSTLNGSVGDKEVSHVYDSYALVLECKVRYHRKAALRTMRKKYFNLPECLG